MRKIIIFYVVMVLATGCAAKTAFLERNLVSRVDELTYTNAAKPPVEKKGSTLTIGSFVVEDVLPPATTVVETSAIVAPLLVINSFRQIYQVNPGYDRIINDYKEFMKESFVHEVEQSSILGYVERQGDFAVDVTVHKIQIAAPIVLLGAVFITPLGSAGGGEQLELGPLAVDVQAKVVFKRNDAVLINKNVGGSYKIDIDPSRDYICQKNRMGEVAPEIVIQDYTLFIIDGLSLAISDLNKNIVTMIDQEAEAIIRKR